MRLTVATCLWDANDRSQPFSAHYDETWAEKLYRGFRRHLSMPFDFVVFTDRPRAFAEPAIQQQALSAARPDYGCMIEPFRLDSPSIVVGLDTVVTGNIDHLAAWCFEGDRVALPISPGKPYACNGVALVPAGQKAIFEDWRGENDMDWLRARPHRFIDDLFPGAVASYKLQVRPNGLADTRIVYFHGAPKPPSLGHEAFVAEHWV